MKNNKKLKANYLEGIPFPMPDIIWSEEEGMVTLHVPNKGIMKRITQILIRKPKISYIHFDTQGSFVWLLIDGKRSILEMGKSVKEHFGEKSEPLYPRLAQFFKILEDNNLITYIEK